MIDYATYEATTGRILRVGVTQQLHTQAINPGEAVVAGKGMPSTHRVVGGLIQERPTNLAWISADEIMADGIDEAAVGAIPVGSSVMVDGPVDGSLEVNDGEFIFTTEVPGEYEITVFSFPEKNKAFKVVAA